MLIELVNQIAKIPSFTTYEDRIWPLVEQYFLKLPVTLTRISENNCIVSWAGNCPGRPIAITAHLDKINHFGISDYGELPVLLDGDEIVGQLDDAVGVAICLHTLSECVHLKNCPPILILLSEMEEKSSYKKSERLKNTGIGIELSPGAHRIADYLISQNIVPEAVITIDTSPVFRKTGGIAVYTEFWGHYGIDSSSLQLSAKTGELANRIAKIDPDVYHANGVTDYLTYGMRFNELKGSDIPSIAIEPAIWPMHQIDERMKIADIQRVSSILLELLKAWKPLKG